VEIVNKLLQSLLRRHRPDATDLSAYIDGRLGSGESRSLEAHLTSCDACRAQIDALRSMRTTLAALPEVEHPRSFRLRLADVEPAPARPAASPLGVTMKLMPLVSAAAGLVFVLVLGADLAGGGGGAQLAASRAESPSQARVANAFAPTPFASAESVGSGSVAGAAAPTAPSGPLAAMPLATPFAGDAAPQPPAPATVPTAGAAFDSAATASQAESSGNKAVSPSPSPELSATSQRQTNSGGGIDGTRATEIIAAAVALLAAAAAIGWRMRQRGAST
jgi:hypothetical protein